MTAYPGAVATEPLLALDTSAGTCVAVVVEGRSVVSRELVEARGHAEHLAPLIEAALADAGVSGADLAGIAVGTGPAPFTGLRVGLVSATMLGRALGIPVWGVPSLDAWAAAAFASDAELESVRVVTDARRKEIYSALYERTDGGVGFHQVGDFAVGKASDLFPSQELRATDTLVGPGLALYPEWAEASGARLTKVNFDVGQLAVIGAARAAAGEPTGTEPLYLRRPDVHGVAGGRL